MSFSDFGRNAMAATVLTKPATATTTVATTTTKKKDDPHRRFSDPLSPSSSSQQQQQQQRSRRRDYGVYDEKRRRRSTATSSKPDPCNSSNRRQSDGGAIITRRKNKEEGRGSRSNSVSSDITGDGGNNNNTTNNNIDCIIHRGVRPRLKLHHLPFMDEIAFSPEDASLTTTSISSDYYDDDDGWSKDDGSYSIHLNQSQTQTQTQQTTIWPNNNMRYPKHYNNLPQQRQKSSRRQLQYTQQQQQHQHKKKPSTKTLVSSQVALFQIMVAELDTKSKQQHAQTCSSPGAMFKSRILLQSAQEADRDLKLVIQKQLEEQNNMHNNNNGSSPSTTKAQRLAEASSKKLQRDYDRASAQLYSIIHETKRRQLADIRSLQTSNDTKTLDKEDPIEEEEDFFDRAMRERQQEIQTINTKMHTVQEIYNDLAYLIDTQQEQIDDIEVTNEDTKVETKAGLEQIQYGMWALCASTTTEYNNNNGGAAKSGRGTNRNQNKNVNTTTLLKINNSKDDDTTFGIHHKHGTASRSTPTMKHVLSSTRPKMAVHEMLNFMLCQGGDGSSLSVSQHQQQDQQQDQQYRVNYHDTGPDILDGRKKKHPYPTIQQQQQQQQQGEMEELRVPPPPSSPLLPVEEDIEYPDAMDFLFHRTSDENNDDDDDEILLNTTKRRISKNGNDTGGNDDHMSISSSLPFRSTASVTAGGSGDDLDGNGSLPTVAWKNMIPLSPSKLENLHYSANVVYERGQNIMGDMVEKVQDAMAKQSTSSIKLPALIKVDTEALRNSISCTVPFPTEDQHLFVDVDNNNIIERTNSDSNISRNRNRNSEGDTVIDRNDDDDSSDEYHHRRHQKESSLRRRRRSKSSKSPTSSNRHHRRSKSQQHRDGSHSSSSRRKIDDNHRSQRRSASSVPSSSSSSRRRRS